MRLKTLIYFLFILALAGCAETLAPQANEQDDAMTKQDASVQDKNSDKLEWLQVSLNDGFVAMPPFEDKDIYHFMPVEFTIHEGTCQHEVLYQFNRLHWVTLCACYRNNVLYLDYSHYDLENKTGAALLYANPLWEDGFIYHNVCSSGYTRMKNVTVTVRKHSE